LFGCLIISAGIWEIVNFYDVDRYVNVYGTRLMVSDEMLRTAIALKNITTSLKETYKEYENILNQYGSGDTTLSFQIRNMDGIHAGALGVLEKSAIDLEGMISAYAPLLHGDNELGGSQYENDLMIIKDAKQLLIEIINFNRVSRPRKNTVIRGIFLTSNPRLVSVENMLQTTITLYSISKAINYHESSRRTELRSQHLQGILAAFITSLFYFYTVIPFIPRKNKNA
jgi:hypothetical protein